MNKVNEFFLGFRTGIPIFLGFFPVATTFSMMASNAGLSMVETNGISIFLLAGASQMMAMNLIIAGSGMVEIILSVGLINIRHFIMSTYIMNKIKNISLYQRCLLAFGVTDETFAVFSSNEEHQNKYFLAGLEIITYGSWIIGTALGAVIINLLPTTITNNLGVAIYAMFIALLIPEVKKYKIGGLTALAGMLLNYLFQKVMTASWAIIFAMIIAAYIGYFLNERKENEYAY